MGGKEKGGRARRLIARLHHIEHGDVACARDMSASSSSSEAAGSPALSLSITSASLRLAPLIDHLRSGATHRHTTSPDTGQGCANKHKVVVSLHRA